VSKRGLRWCLLNAEQGFFPLDEAVSLIPLKIGLFKQGCALLKEAFKRGKFSDVEFLLDDGSKRIGGHKSILSAASLEFRNMFASGMREDQTGTVSMVGVREEAVKGLLEFIYTGKNPSPVCSKPISFTPTAHL
jgi:hypothetical protein